MKKKRFFDERNEERPYSGTSPQKWGTNHLSKIPKLLHSVDGGYLPDTKNIYHCIIQPYSPLKLMFKNFFNQKVQLATKN